MIDPNAGEWMRVRKAGDHWLYFRRPLEMNAHQAARRVLRVGKVQPSVTLEACLHQPVGLKLVGTREGIRYYYSQVEPSK